MIALPNFAANLAQTEDIISNYAPLVQSEAQLGVPGEPGRPLAQRVQEEVSIVAASTKYMLHL